MKHILALVRKCVEDYNMIDEGDRIAVGVSGGKDSLLLLAAMARLQTFYPKKFTVEAITIDPMIEGLDFSPVQHMCDDLGVPYHLVRVPIYDVVFVDRKEKNPCSLCAKFRRGALSTEMNRLGISKIALGHHKDDAVETLMMNLFQEGRIGCFQPVTYLDRSRVTQLRPLLYAWEDDVRRAANRLQLPIVKNPCPADGATQRQDVKELLKALEKDYPNLRTKLFGAMQRLPLYGWSLEEDQR